MSGKQCAKIFQKKGRYASANYCIGVKGDIVCNVYEEDRAYTSSSKWNDLRAITIEVSNNKVGGKWTVSDASYKSLIKLCVDICKRYGFRLNYNKKKTGSLTMHCYYASTACPGAYLKSKFPDIEKEVNAKLDDSNIFKPYKVIVTAKDGLNVREEPTTNSKIITTLKKGKTCTILEEKKGWGKIKIKVADKMKTGWIFLKYTKRK